MNAQDRDRREALDHGHHSPFEPVAGCSRCQAPSAAHKRELDALDHALANDIEYPTELVGYHVPDWAREWGEQNNLTVRESEFAPRGMLYVIGAIPAVEGIEASRV